MLRCSVTELDLYRRYRGDEEGDLELLLRQLRRAEPPSRAMQAGRAFHTILENAKPGQVLERAEQDGFFFRFDVDCALPLPRVRELKGEPVMPTSIGPVTLVGVVDGLDGYVRDYKLTARFDAERYADSYQWRCYLVMFNAQRFDYDVFEQREDGDTFCIHAYHPMRLYAYPGMHEDVLRELDAFARFAYQHLPERFKVAA